MVRMERNVSKCALKCEVKGTDFFPYKYAKITLTRLVD